MKFLILTEKDLTLINKNCIINMYQKNEIILYENTKKGWVQYEKQMGNIDT